jgi:hypothetical protein
MRLLDRLMGNQEPPPQPAAAAAAPPTADAPLGRNLLGLAHAVRFPPSVEDYAADLVSRYRPQEIHRQLNVYARAGDWNGAFPYAVAYAKQSWCSAAIKAVGVCFLKAAEATVARAARVGGGGGGGGTRMSDDNREYVRAAIMLLTLAIDHGEIDWNIYELRGAAHLLAAQVGCDRRALDLAEADFRTSQSIKPTDVVRRNLARVEDLRRRWFVVR